MNIKQIIEEFFNPRFSTDEIENSKLRSNLVFMATSMYFDDEQRNYPTHVLGFVITRRETIVKASWNQHGECTVKGKRIKSFDMVRPTQKEMDSAKTVFTSLALGLIVIVISIIF